MTKKQEEIFNEFIALSRERDEQFDQICDIAKKGVAHNKETHKVLKNIEESSEILKIFRDTKRPEIREFAKRLVEGVNEMAETKGEVKQIDKRIESSENWMRNQTRILLSVILGVSAIIIGLLIKIAFWGFPQ